MPLINSEIELVEFWIARTANSNDHICGAWGQDQSKCSIYAVRIEMATALAHKEVNSWTHPCSPNSSSATPCTENVIWDSNLQKNWIHTWKNGLKLYMTGFSLAKTIEWMKLEKEKTWKRTSFSIMREMRSYSKPQISVLKNFPWFCRELNQTSTAQSRSSSSSSFVLVGVLLFFSHITNT